MTLNEKKPAMYIFTGLSFAGKSVLAKAIQKVTGFDIVDPDAISHEMGLGLHGEFLSTAQWDGIHSEAERRARNKLKEGKSVLYDTTSYTKGQRDRLRHVAEESDATAKVLYTKISREEAYQRWQTNNLTKERFIVHIDDFNSVADNFEPPSENENAIIYTTGENISDWIRNNILRPGEET
ncbi:MAG TPA: AAA family ATPase [Ktedonobacteraceae bacterium]|nr:AAA family ATPase [Ktedonobacteraceae bacterium]